MTTPRFLAPTEALAASRVLLTGAELRHLRVRRLHEGSEVIVFDGLGCEKNGVVVTIDRRQAIIRLEERAPARDSPLQLTLAQALLKSDKLDDVVARATELGVCDVYLFTSERTLGRCSAERLARWARIARSAAKQCQRATVPLIHAGASFAEVLALHPDRLRLFFWENGLLGGLSHTHRGWPHAAGLLAVIGPEGGFSATEAAQAAAAGFHVVALARRILRADTAALAALTLCQFLWGDFVEPDS